MSVGSERVGNDDRLRRIEVVIDADLARLEVSDLLVELLGRVRELLSVDTAGVHLLDPASGQLVATAARGVEEEVRQDVRLPLDAGFIGRVATEQVPVAIADVRPDDLANPILYEAGIRSLLGVPMLANGALIGVLHVGTVEPRSFGEDDTNLLRLVADRIALATQARLSGIDRAAAVALQRSLLPTRLPDLPGLSMAARYVPGHDIGVGGDWYDVFPLDGGRVGIVMGDVAGHGLRAAVVMGRLRSALRAYAIECDDPADVVTRLDRKAQHFEPDMMATVLYGILDPPRDRLRVSLAGHLPPVRAVPDQPTQIVELPVDLPIGTRIGRPRHTHAVDLPPGSVICFYTDGLVERRGICLDIGLKRLADAVTAGPPEAVCGMVMARLIGADRPADDVALLTVRRT